MRQLWYLTEHPYAPTHQIAVDLGVSNGAAYYLLKALLDTGFMKAQSFANSNSKTKYLYVLTPKGTSQKLALTRQFLGQKRQEYEALEIEIRAMQQELQKFDYVAP